MKVFKIILFTGSLWVPLFGMHTKKIRLARNTSQKQNRLPSGIVGLDSLPTSAALALEQKETATPVSKQITWQAGVAGDMLGRKLLKQIESSAEKTDKNLGVISSSSSRAEIHGNISPLVALKYPILPVPSSTENIDKSLQTMDSSSSNTEQKVVVQKRLLLAPNLVLFSAYSVEEIEQCLETMDPNITNSEGKTAVHINLWPESVRRLLEKGGDPNALDVNGCTPLHDAIMNHQEEKISVLLEFGAHPDIKNKEGKSPIDIAGKESMMRLLIAKLSEAKILESLKERKKNVLLRMAVRSKYKLDTNLMVLHKETSLTRIELFLLAGMNVNQKNENEDRPLHKAQSAGAVKLFMSYKADPRAKNNKGKTALHTIADKDALKALLDHAANLVVDIYDEKGLTPLHQAVLDENIERVQLLLQYQHARDIRDKSEKGRSVLECAKNVEIMNMLLADGFDPHVRNTRDNGNTSIHRALTSEIIEVLAAHQNPNLEGLEQAYSAVDILNDLGQTPLHVQCANPKVDLKVIEKLILLGADPNAKDYEGNAPLHFAICSLETTKFLCSIADVTATDAIGNTYIHLALVPSVIEYLKKHIDINKHNARGETPFKRWARILQEKTEEEKKLELIGEAALEEDTNLRIKILQEDQRAIRDAMRAIMKIFGFDFEDQNIQWLVCKSLPTQIIMDQASSITQAQHPAPIFRAGSDEQLVPDKNEKKKNRLSKAAAAMASIIPSTTRQPPRVGLPASPPLGSPTTGGSPLGSPLSSPHGLGPSMTVRPKAESGEKDKCGQQ